jgi:hypothetical protein
MIFMLAMEVDLMSEREERLEEALQTIVALCTSFPPFPSMTELCTSFSVQAPVRHDVDGMTPDAADAHYNRTVIDLVARIARQALSGH